MTNGDGILTAGEEAIEAQLREIAAAVEGLPPCGTAASVRRYRTTAPARAARQPAPVLAKVAVLVFAVMVAGAGVLVAVEYQPGGSGHHIGVIPHLMPVADLVAGTTTGPCAGQPPGCGSAESSPAALAGGRWSRFASGPLKARFGQVEVWTGHELLVWGGQVNQETGADTADGAAYDPVTGKWRMLPTSPLSPRMGAAAAWTGGEMIVVGGVSGSDENVGDDAVAAYDPATDRWSSLPPFPLEPRRGATAIWTGRQLLVFGGQGTTGAVDRGLDDGAVYTPATNTWTVLPAVPAQPGWKVLGSSAGWTGQQLTVWVTWQQSRPCGSGCGSIYERELGFLLAAGASSWEAVGKPGVETDLATTAWTGTEFLVFGGVYCPWSCPPPVPASGAYRPGSRTWVPISTFRGPAGILPDAVWTGRALVNDYRNGLGAYDPATQQWRTLPTAPASVAQDNAPAVWTGRQLLVWGPNAEVLTAS